MKKLMIMGGFIGFGIGAITGYLRDVTTPELFLRASVCALLAGLLFRWWGRIWLAGLKESLAQATAAPKPARPTPPAK